MPRKAPANRAMTMTKLPANREDAIAAILDVFRTHDHFLITSHARPDGDAIGSSLAAMYLLQAMGKQAVVALADPVPRAFAGLPGADRIVRTQPVMAAEVAVVLECDSVARTGFDHLAAPVTINIDHHRSGANFASLNWIDASAAAVCAMLYDLATAAGVPISPAFATCLYTGLLTDTVRFTVPSLTSETFALAHQLVQLGADAAGVAEAVYLSVRPARLRVLATALAHFQIDGPVAWTAVTLGEIEAARAEVEDCEDIVNHIIGVEGICAGAFLREMPGGCFRVSLRSKGKIDVAVVAERLGGGGHQNASGCTITGNLPEITAQLTAALGRACTESGAPPPFKGLGG